MGIIRRIRFLCKRDALMVDFHFFDCVMYFASAVIIIAYCAVKLMIGQDAVHPDNLCFLYIR
ncbi:Uncharacterised protein [Mycobacteroides abscessus subsp. abscessus]|nr:Uncharacterised protein [Mycobacteroides abscessus subsp. abscessus]